MAVEPLYNKDLETLLQRVRVSTYSDEQSEALIFQTVTEVRIGFRDVLGSTRMNTIAGYSLVDNPSTDQEFLRANAAATEATWVTWLLAQRLPVLFMDNSDSIGDKFNDEPLSRDAEYKDAKYLKNLKLQLDKGLDMLKEPEQPSTGAVKVGTVKGTSKIYYPNVRSEYGIL